MGNRPKTTTMDDPVFMTMRSPHVKLIAAFIFPWKREMKQRIWTVESPLISWGWVGSHGEGQPPWRQNSHAAFADQGYPLLLLFARRLLCSTRMYSQLTIECVVRLLGWAEHKPRDFQATTSIYGLPNIIFVVGADKEIAAGWCCWSSSSSSSFALIRRKNRGDTGRYHT